MFLVKTIVIDACVAIDLNIPKVRFLEEFLNCLGDDHVLISTVNFGEIYDYKTQKLLKESDNVEIINNNETEFDTFSSELEKLRLNLSPKDRHVLFLANASKADFLVSSDFNVFDKTVRFKKLKSLNYMEPLTTVLLLDYIYNKGKIGFSVFFEKSLYLYKYKEIDNMLEHLSKQNLNVPKPTQIEIINGCKDSMRERFQFYKDPLISEFRQLIALRKMPS